MLRNTPLMLFDKHSPEFLVGCSLIPPSTLFSNQIYRHFIDLKFQEDITSKQKWLASFSFQENDWNLIYQLAFKCTKETKLQAFQFSILHRYVPHKKRLKLIGVCESDTCDFCDCLDTIVHRFFYCRQAVHFWTSIEHWWNSFNSSNIKLNAQDVIFGLYKCGDCTLNNMLLQAKYFLHKEVLKKMRPTLNVFKLFLKNKIESEEINYSVNDLPTTSRWRKVKPHL